MKNVIAKRLRDARLLRKLSQSELANRSGFEPSAISHFENGQRLPSAPNLIRLCRALAVSSDHIIGLVNPRGPAVGEMADNVLMSFGRMSADDQASLVIFADMLANKPKAKKGCAGE